MRINQIKKRKHLKAMLTNVTKALTKQMPRKQSIITKSSPIRPHKGRLRIKLAKRSTIELTALSKLKPRSRVKEVRGSIISWVRLR